MVRSEAIVGRYALSELIGSGGMARVYVGRLQGWAGFSKAVAVKRLHPDLARDPEFSAMLLDEARLTAHIRHPNVVATQDVVCEDGEFLLVMDYVVGVSLDVLLNAAIARSAPPPEEIVAAVVSHVLRGLHAAHDACDAQGKPLAIVHRDMSPPNVIIDESGVAKVLDFGIATATDRLTTTKEGAVKGKPAYIAPEQLERGTVDRRADVYAVGVILWELLAGRRLHAGASFASVREAFEHGDDVPDPSAGRASAAATALGEIALHGLEHVPGDRFPTALAMAEAIESAIAPAAPSIVAAWCASLAPDHLRARREAAIHAAAPAPAAEATAVAGPTVIEAPPPGARWRVAVAGVAAVLLLAAIAVGARARIPRHEDTAPVASASPSSDAPPELAAVAVATTPPAPPTPSASAAPPKAGVRAHARAPGPRPTVNADCREPFHVDANGVKIPKRECL